MTNFILGAVTGLAVGLVIGIVMMNVLQLVGDKKRLNNWWIN